MEGWRFLPEGRRGTTLVDGGGGGSYGMEGRNRAWMERGRD